jgi:hypothetical protein
MTAQRGDAALVQCSYMAAAYPTLDADDTCHSHRHEDRIVTLARAMAVEFQRPDPSDEQIAWFLDDAVTCESVYLCIGCLTGHPCPMHNGDEEDW